MTSNTRFEFLHPALWTVDDAKTHFPAPVQITDLPIGQLLKDLGPRWLTKGTTIAGAMNDACKDHNANKRYFQIAKDLLRIRQSKKPVKESDLSTFCESWLRGLNETRRPVSHLRRSV